MTAARYHLALGVACTLPVIIWTLLQDPADMEAGAWPLTTLTAIKALWLILAMGAALFVPWHAHRWSWRDTLLGTLVLVLVGLPFLALVWLSDGATATNLARGLAGLWGFALLATLLGKGIHSLHLNIEAKTIGRIGVQVLLTASVWTFSPLWLSWTGL